MSNTTNDQLNPVSLVLPNYTTTQRDLMIVELGTIIFNTTTSKVNVCDTGQTAGAGAWIVVTST